ncbi:EscS/YscS/HrcS family type III secretion system export apparatus protein [Exilibacterium tricleocarpae]|uniref:EscS/YscS/HrcS family type III secretion system export apparatus protein n=1 Tax=Exilibacterium tricleocarpae TaxID=2591008 RepID=A0A545SY95_9GAMM|nr:type III secretion system export apparatus subunit SctS [Exilibacterium tricleocarpae]TQV69933.1 EscS/YscS/HrcS family type III secretion system export apparatus protein [Exilibacterium tricleocarpae]
MNSEEIVFITSHALILVMVLSLPTVGVGALVGLIVGLFQGLTQIQDQTLSFAFRLLATIAVLIFTSRWMGNELYKFAVEMFNKTALV